MWEHSKLASYTKRRKPTFYTLVNLAAQPRTQGPRTETLAKIPEFLKTDQCGLTKNNKSQKNLPDTGISRTGPASNPRPDLALALTAKKCAHWLVGPALPGSWLSNATLAGSCSCALDSQFSDITAIHT